MSRTVRDLPSHTQVAVEFNFYFIDQWLGEHGYFKIGSQILWTKQHRHCTGKSRHFVGEVGELKIERLTAPKQKKTATFQSNCRGINVCGDDKVADRVGEKVRVVFDHVGPAVTFSFGSTLAKSPCIASYGIDNVAVYVRSVSVFA